MCWLVLGSPRSLLFLDPLGQKKCCLSKEGLGISTPNSVACFFFRIPQKPIVFYHKVITARSLWLKQHKCCPSNNSRIPKKLTVFEHGICTCQNTILVLFWASSFFFWGGAIQGIVWFIFHFEESSTNLHRPQHKELPCLKRLHPIVLPRTSFNLFFEYLKKLSLHFWMSQFNKSFVCFNLFVDDVYLSPRRFLRPATAYSQPTVYTSPVKMCEGYARGR